ncbi:MAG: glycosyltransferase family 4 protein [Anaerolineales bacterium]|nr:glycosyltransferase family 4 protein [Anaerolineales bacterium]
MRVLMIGAGSPPPTFIQRQVDGLRDIGVEIDFLPPIRRYLGIRQRLLQHGFVFQLPRDVSVRVEQADLLHFQWPGHWLIYRNLARKYHKKSVLSLRGRQINVQPYLPGYEEYARDLTLHLPECDAYHCVSYEMLRQAEAFGMPPARARVIYTAVDPFFFVPCAEPIPSSPLRIVMTGALIWRKGYEYALLGFRRALDQGLDAHLTIVGDGAERPRVEYTLQDLGLDKHVTLTGMLGNGSVRDLLQRSHVFLHAALSEGLPNGLIEAMSCGLPVVATAAGGTAEAVTDGVQGFIVPTRQPEAIGDALLHLGHDSDLRTQMGQAGRQKVLQAFNLQDQAQQFRSFYEWVLLGTPLSAEEAIS